MTERPIIFSGPMVRALLAGRKTQTRRIVKGVDECPHGYDVVKHFENGVITCAGGATLKCPYGVPGDRLWVRETFREDLQHFESPNREPELYGYLYRADPDEKDDKRRPWKPAIHMPRAACRLRLEVTGVRVERLQDISEDDAVHEGAECIGRNGCAPLTYINGYRALWDSLNAGRGYGWPVNPWVWVIEFRREK